MKRFGLIGYPLGHSFSREYFRDKFDAEGVADASYENFPLEKIEDMPALLEACCLDGFNVTAPYKEAVITYLDELSTTAATIGAVNCVVRLGGKLYGHNTDEYGFRSSLLEFIGDERPRTLILGSGGASRAAQYVLGELGIGYKVVSTSKSGDGVLSYEMLDRRIMKDHRLIVNCTPLGTYPDVSGAPPIPYGDLSADHLLFDMVYNPPLTRFLELGKDKGARICNGNRMLVLQAERSWEIFKGAE